MMPKAPIPTNSMARPIGTVAQIGKAARYMPISQNLARRFTFSLKGVVAGIPPSFLDLLDRTIDAAKAFRPFDSADAEELKQMATNCESIFLREEQQVALNRPHWVPVYPDCPHECAGHLA